MNLIIEKLDSIDSLSLENLTNLTKLIPSKNELIALSRLKNVTPHVYQAMYDNTFCAVAVFIVEKRQLHKIKLNSFSLLGHDFFDYNFFYCEPRFYSNFLSYITLDAKKFNSDIIVLENILLHANDKTIESKKIDKQQVYIFDANEEGNKRFNFILQKQSLRRHYNKVVKKFDYSCQHKRSNVHCEDIHLLAQYHKERWEFDEIKSAFLSNDRSNVYLTHKDNKLLTILRHQQEVIAIHYGMIFDNVLLWHTPAINIKYLEFSPIELLLFEIAKFCNENHLDVIDFGLGSEKYKKRFSNSQRMIGYQLVPISYKGVIAEAVRKFVDFEFMKSISSNYLPKIKRFVNKFRKLTNQINYYMFLPDQQRKIIQRQEVRDLRLVVINSFPELVDFFRINNIPIKRYQYNRMKSGDLALVLVQESKQILSYGWATRKSFFYISEIRKTICNKGKLLLYDFNTPLEFRRKGYYTTLLNKISLEFDDVLAIFAEKNNLFSNRAIIRTNFLKSDYALINPTTHQLQNNVKQEEIYG